ncbi:hypothetical protein, partial [Streptomyces sp. NPDC005209]|uniref:hypothetical protein n=1 Tax=Streptomyces sp. NPDC005209 TaxID=3156715 RepID=UPI0033B9F4BF
MPLDTTRRHEDVLALRSAFVSSARCPSPSFLTPADAWKHTHNHLHHTYTNVVGLDRDLGY